MSLKLLPNPRRLLKRVLYSQMSILDGFNILLGRQQPTIAFMVEADPPSVYFNFRVRADKLADFEQFIALPGDLPLAPIACLRGEQPDVLLTLNVYRVSGISSGIRAEWSTYIRDRDGKPRFMVLEARSSTFSMDPVDIITRASRVEHHGEQGQVMTCVESDGGRLFEAQCTTEGAELVELAPEWVAANDYIYWRNGICDRAYYDAGLANARVLVLAEDALALEDGTAWAQFVETKPRQVLVFTDAIDFMISPWWNA